MSTTTDPPALPGNGERFTFPECEIVFRGFLALGPAAHVEFARRSLMSWRPDRPRKTHDARARLVAVRAREAAAELSAPTVSVGEYRRLRQENPRDWPSTGGCT
jgi:hypothetical protein